MEGVVADADEVTAMCMVIAVIVRAVERELEPLAVTSLDAILLIRPPSASSILGRAGDNSVGAKVPPWVRGLGLWGVDPTSTAGSEANRM